MVTTRMGMMAGGAALLLAAAGTVLPQVRTQPQPALTRATALDCTALQRLEDLRLPLEDLGRACDPRTGVCGRPRPKPLECTPGNVQVPKLSTEQKKLVASGLAQVMAAYGVTAAEVRQAGGK